MTYSAYIFTDDTRDQLIEAVPLVHQYTNASDHIIYKSPDFQAPQWASSIKVVGVAQNDEAQALIVEINGTTTRPDGGIFHTTWSLKKGVKPTYTNKLISEHGWNKLEYPIDIKAIPVWL